MDNERASSDPPKLCNRKVGRGAFHVRGRRDANRSGAHGKANVGMSNDKAGENPAHRKTKVSYSMFIRIGLAGT